MRVRSWFTSRRTLRYLPNLETLSSVSAPAQVETAILKGAPLANRLRREIASAKAHLSDLGGRPPVLATLIVGADPAALAYRSSIERTCRRVNVSHRAVELRESTNEVGLLSTITMLNMDPEITGIVMLMPLPEHLDPHVVLEHLSPLKDVDGITPTNAGRLHLGLPSLRPSTPAGGVELLEHAGVELSGARVAVVGRSNVVGRPLATLLTQKDATVLLCHSRTRDLTDDLRQVDVVCVAVGQPGLITGDMIRPGATVLDFGVNVADDGSLVGDVDYDSMLGVAGAITPVPGGTGPVTALVLVRNTIAASFATLDGSLDNVLFDLPEAVRIAESKATG